VIYAYTIPKILITNIKGVKYAEASGNKPMEYRKKPNPPSFNRIPARITEPEVGASQCASGSQI
jgi:hypothetical protein